MAAGSRGALAGVRQRAITQENVEQKMGPARVRPLGDASNRGSAHQPVKDTAARKPQRSGHRRAAAAVAPPLELRPVSSSEAALPGLEEGEQLLDAGGHLPLGGDDKDGFTALGNAFENSLRVTSLSRSVAARRISTVRLVVQPDAAEGRRLQSQVPLAQRPAVRARTVALKQHAEASIGTAAPSSTTSSSSSCSAEADMAVGGTQGTAPSCHASDADGPAASGGSSEEPATEASSTAARERGSSQALPQPPPLPVRPGAAAVTSSCQAPPVEVGAAGSVECQRSITNSTAAASCSAGAIAAEDVPPSPACSASFVPWLAQQECFAASPAMYLQPPAFMSFDRQETSAVWRSMWLAGLQWHNAWRVGQPIRVGSSRPFIPVDVSDQLFEVLMLESAVMPEHVISGAARFQDILLDSPELHSQAVQTGVLSYGLWGVAAPDGTYMVLGDGQQMALPISFGAAPPHIVALFLACVWHEANRAEAQHLTCTFTATGERVADESCLKYAPEELHSWVRLALGCEQVAHESMAALTRLAVFGA